MLVGAETRVEGAWFREEGMVLSSFYIYFFFIRTRDLPSEAESRFYNTEIDFLLIKSLSVP